MRRGILPEVVVASVALVAGSVWLGIGTGTAVAFMVLYAWHTWRTA